MLYPTNHKLHNTSYDNNNSKYTVIQPSTSQKEFVAVTLFFCLLIIVNLVGNGLIFAAYVVNARLRSITNKLILGLAVSDMLVGLVSIPLWVYISTMEFTGAPYSKATYHFYITFDIFVGSASILQLTSMSIERCHAILRPLHHRTLSQCAFRTLISIPWIFSALIAALHPIQYHSWQEVYTLLMATTCFFIPFVIIVTAYVCIYIAARARPSTESFRFRHRMSQRNSFRKEVRLSVTIAVITVLFVIAWMPLFVLSIIATYFPSSLVISASTDRLLKFAKWMHYSNSSCNPFLYAFRNQEMIRTFRRIISKLLCGYFTPRLRSYGSGRTSRRAASYRGSDPNYDIPRMNSIRDRRDANCNEPKPVYNPVMMLSSV
ncbi:octopamine receptor Oamb-like [Nematostella vectensis]|uniref:octopamine receptor Oamb-like n=1 Tax=Nematostella vectensis TaxID=45351 RepID=UPI0020774637|nr:octopamine receptor Oamb-like [Nematostella vectensis]XP_048586270.1 octopamine receptor Oamb-like [Nematostella vectensis]XP_048586271.1 octopamine receptor Oamb-like [Nematostella vectensis]XP_048586272.1 octopamine receptor Oamb-like [Nematostella vectensis]XP_048586273.1 octopamine receptor Oamb-like [Nematostella vectensis]